MARNLMQATQSFATSVNKVPVMVGRGDLYFDDDEVVRRNGLYFTDVEVKSSAANQKSRVAVSSVETATAEPGTVRRMTKPKVQKVELDLTSEV